MLYTVICFKYQLIPNCQHVVFQMLSAFEAICGKFLHNHHFPLTNKIQGGNGGYEEVVKLPQIALNALNKGYDMRQGKFCSFYLQNVHI